MVWLVIDTFWGKRQGEVPDDDPAVKNELDSKDK